MEKGYAFVYMPGERVPTRLGLLELDQTPRSLAGRFTYSKDFLNHPKRFEIDPRLPLTKAPYVFGDGEPIFGAFADAAPDRWGRYVISNKLRKLEATEMEYLVNASADRIGAITVSATSKQAASTRMHQMTDLEALMRAAELIEEGKPLPPELDLLLDPGPSAGGARPKDTILHKGHEWIAKFPSRDDKIDIARLEYAALRMAGDCQISVPPIELASVGGKAVLLIRRFDRVSAGDGTFFRRHYMSALTAEGKGEMDSPLLSYPGLAELLRQKGGQNFKADCAMLYRRMVFNLFVGNDDDHGKNHAFLIDPKGRLELSEVYDIVPKPRVGHTYFLAIGLGSDGREGTVKNALSRAEVFGIQRHEAIEIMEQVRTVVVKHRVYLADAGMDEGSIEKVSPAFLPPEIDNGIEPDVPAMSRAANR